MAFYRSSIIIGSLSLLLSIAHAGTAVSGGGGAYVCRDSSGDIISSELVDVWEAKNVYSEPILISNDPVEAQIERAIKRIRLVNSKFADRVEANLNHILANILYLKSGVALSPPLDALPNYQKAGCPLEGMMLYDGVTDQLLIDRYVFSKLLSKTDAAAAMVHEAVYKTLREYASGHTDSVKARIIVGKMFSSTLIPKAEAQLPSEKVRHCSNQNLDFYLYPAELDGKLITRMLFTRILNTKYAAGLVTDVLPWNGTVCPQFSGEHSYFANLGIPKFRLEGYCANSNENFFPRFDKLYDPYDKNFGIETGAVFCSDIQ